MNAFISWAGADRDVKNAIVSHLEGINCYDSDEFCCTNFSAECIQNIRRSQIFIVIVSDASMDPKSYVINEVIEARRLEGEGQLNILVYKITDNPYTESFAFNLNHISDANHVSRTQSNLGISGIETLAKRVKLLVERRLNGTPEKPNDVLVPHVLGSAVTQTKYFVNGSRSEILEQIDDALLNSNVLILSEFFGFGKKSVIKKYVQSHPDISAVEIYGMHDSLFQFFLADLHFSNINEDVFDKNDDKDAIRKKFEFLKKLTEKDLIVIYDIDIEDTVDEFICSLIGELKCKIVFITQNAASSYSDIFPVIAVGRMENEHLFELFFHYYKCAKKADRELLVPYLEAFFDEIGGHTKTIELTATVLFKDLRATPSEAALRLSSGSSDNRELKDKIFNTLSELLLLNDFTEDERNTLLLVSLMANPVIDEGTLFDLMKRCEISSRSTITALDEHGWISYDARTKSIYIEPFIAQICVKEFSDNEYVALTCLEYFLDNYATRDVFITSVSTQHVFISRIENFFKLLKLDLLSDIVKTFKIQSISNTNDYEKIEKVCNRFSARYHELFPEGDNPTAYESEYVSIDEISTEYEIKQDTALEFEKIAMEWAHSYFFFALKASQKLPELYSFSNGIGVSLNELRKTVIDKDIEELIATELSDSSFLDIIKKFDAYKDFDSITYLLSLLCTAIIYAIYKKDFNTAHSKCNELWNFLKQNPQVLEDNDASTLVISLIRALHISYMQSRAYHGGAAFYEGILDIEWPIDLTYRLRLLYVEFLLTLKNEADFALSVVEDTSELFDEAMTVCNATEAEYEISKIELDFYHAKALANALQLDEAIEKYESIKSIEGTDPYLLILINTISSRLTSTDFSRAVSFISDNKDLIEKHINSEETNESDREDLRYLLFLCDMDVEGEVGFTDGGIISDASYYQRYSKDKKNNIFAMRAYENLASKARRYDFSGASNEELLQRASALRSRAEKGESKNIIIPEAFALVSEAGYRVLGFRHHQVQYVGAAAMLDGKIAEILNGEGKTYTITLVAFVNSLYSKKTFVIDSSKYLTKRNFNWMLGIYELLGVKTGYSCYYGEMPKLIEDDGIKIIYTDLITLGFSMLSNELSLTHKPMELSRFSIIIDEADSVLIDSAEQSISFVSDERDTSDTAKKFINIYKLVTKIKNNGEYYSTDKNGRINLNREITQLIESTFNLSYENLAQVNECKRIEELIIQILHITNFERDKDFFIRNGNIYRENKSTGVLYEVNAQKGLIIALENHLPYEKYMYELARKRGTTNLTYVYSIIRSFGTICGTSATVCSFKKEFQDLYSLDVVAIPPALPIKRQDMTVGIYVTIQDKKEDILELIVEKQANLQPILLIVEDISESAEFSSYLDSIRIKHTVINGLNSEKSPEIFASAGMPGSVVIATKVANRGVDIKLGGDAERMTLLELIENGVDVTDIDKIAYRVPTEKVKASELYSVYSSTLAKNKLIAAANKKAVIAAGGLCVISTAADRDLRIEQQIRGRAGRQGDVGESYIFISMEDSAFGTEISRIKEMGIWSAINTDSLRCLQSPILTKSIENFRNNMHHKTFSGMTNATAVSKRVEKSKKKLLELKNGLVDGTLSLNDVLAIWCKNEDNVSSARNISLGNTQNATPAVYKIWQSVPEYFEGVTQKNASERLLNAAYAYVEKFSRLEDARDQKLAIILKFALADHLTEMQDAEDTYNAINIKNSDKFFDKMYSESLAKHITNAISYWLTTLDHI